jgi:hypothetical protein
MNFSTEALEAISEIMVSEMERMGMLEANLYEVENTLRVLLQKVGAVTLSQVLERRDEQENASGRLECGCGGEQEYRFRRPAVILSVFGRVRYKRRYYSCANCHQGKAPLDEQVGVKAGQVTAALAELLALAGVEVAFEEATRLVKHFLQVDVSDNTIRKETERFGALQQAQEQVWQEQSQDLEWLDERYRQPGQTRPARLYASIDGVMTPLQDEWREMKTWAWYRVEPLRSYQERRHHATRPGEQNDLQAQDIHYYCDIQSAHNLDALFWATACRHQADLAEEVVFVCDGAAWIWKLVERHFPKAVQIVDWYHASAYLPPIAEAAFGSGSQDYEQWLEQARNLLWEGQIDDLIHECRRLANGPAAQAVQTAVNYFSNNRHRMEYARFRQNGYFIGSGTVESGAKQIAAMRLKRCGARWTESGAIQTAKARAAWLSGDWQTLAAKRAALPLAT